VSVLGQRAAADLVFDLQPGSVLTLAGQ